MPFERFFSRCSCLVAFALLHAFPVLALGAEEKDETPAVTEKPAAKEEVAKPASKPEKEDRYQLPGGGVSELLAFIRELAKYRPTTTREFFEFQQKAPAAFESAAKKILELENDKDSDAYRQATSILMQLLAQRIGRVDAKEQRSILKQITDYLSSKESEGQDLNLAMRTASALEDSGAEEMAAEAYEAFGKLFAKSKNRQITVASQVFTAIARRLNLVGNPLELQGTKLDGTKFDLTKLKGKVVLVDFWATWCGPCVAEFPNIKKNYDKYHAQGFEVIGVSLDEDRERLEKYVEERQVPWITLNERDAGGQNPAAERYAINSIPVLFLVGREGNVISLDARGEELDRLLAKQFGDVEPAKEAKDEGPKDTAQETGEPGS